MEKKYNESDVVVRFKNVTKKFGDFTAVSNISIDIYKGEVLGFLGPNGAGKSTTMKMMAKLINPSSGEILIKGNGELEKLDVKNKDYLLDNIGFLIENPFFYEKMTPRQILSYFAELKGYPTKFIDQRVEEVVKMVGLSDWIDKKTGTFSKGMRQKIGIISAIVHDPQIAVLDEPHTGLDPKARSEIREFILSLKAQGKTIFLSSHLLYEVSEVADRVAIISHGEIVACDTLDNLEAKAKRSVIDIELFNDSEDKVQKNIESLEKIVRPLSGLDISINDIITFDSTLGIYEIQFNGSPENQKNILKQLILENIEITDFSVPKAGLLEDLYLEFVNDSDESFAKIKSQKSIKTKEEEISIEG